MAITTAPPRNEPKPATKKAEKKIIDVINKGGKPSAPSPSDERVLRNFNVKIFDEELARINELRALRPKPRSGKRLGVSIHDWIVEAIQEKIEREGRKFRD